MNKNQANNFTALWVKYSEYEIVEEKKVKYIKPSENAQYEVYDPFEIADEILVDILNIGKLAGEDKYVDKSILEFVNKYGLMGELTYLPLNNNLVYQKKVFLPKNNPITTKDVLPIEEYLEKFLVCDKKHRIQIFTSKDKNGPIGISNNSEITANLFLNRGIEYNVVFSKGYSEQLQWIIEYAKYLYLIFGDIEIYYQQDNDELKSALNMFVKTFKVSNLTCKIEMLEKATVVWDFNSLKQAIDTILLLNETNERKTVKMCKHCGKVFSSQNLKAEYCSPQCRNQANVYKSRAKNNN